MWLFALIGWDCDCREKEAIAAFSHHGRFRHARKSVVVAGSTVQGGIAASRLNPHAGDEHREYVPHTTRKTHADPNYHPCHRRPCRLERMWLLQRGKQS